MLVLKEQQENDSLGEMLRRWRKVRRLSQMEIALRIGVSTRHLSFVERGLAHPSQPLVLDLVQALQLPLRHGNALLLAAGYAPVFSQMGLDTRPMDVVEEALQRILQNHDPYPAVVVDGVYNVLRANESYQRLAYHLVGAETVAKYGNTYRLAFAPDGLQPYFEAWPLVAHFLLGRLWGEAMATQDKRLWSLYEEMKEWAGLPEGELGQLGEQLETPVLSFALRKHGRVWRFFSTFTTFGTPLDVTVQELRIESLFPADEATENWLRDR